MNDDLRLLTMWGLTGLLAVTTLIAIGVVVPTLVNMHNDGALLLAISLMVMLPVTTFIAARNLYRAMRKSQGDTTK